MKKYLCQEFGETFIIEANSWKEANEEAMGYGGSAIRELTKEESIPMRLGNGVVGYSIVENEIGGLYPELERIEED